jgi:hypothetical protein
MKIERYSPSVFRLPSLWSTQVTNQSLNTCVHFSPWNQCMTGADCLRFDWGLEGRPTGVCVIDGQVPGGGPLGPVGPWPIPSGGYCQVYGFCPMEYEIRDPTINTFAVDGLGRSMLFLNVHMDFPIFHEHISNNRHRFDFQPGYNWSENLRPNHTAVCKRLHCSRSINAAPTNLPLPCSFLFVLVFYYVL